METAQGYFGRGVPPVPHHQTHVTQFTFGAGFVPSWEKSSLWWKKARLLMTQEPLKKENLRKDQLKKCFNRKSNEHLTQNHRMRIFWGGARLMLSAELRCLLTAAQLSWSWSACDIITIFLLSATPGQITNRRQIFTTDFGLRSIAPRWQLPPA